MEQIDFLQDLESIVPTPTKLIASTSSVDKIIDFDSLIVVIPPPHPICEDRDGHDDRQPKNSTAGSMSYDI